MCWLRFSPRLDLTRSALPARICVLFFPKKIWYDCKRFRSCFLLETGSVRSTLFTALLDWYSKILSRASSRSASHERCDYFWLRTWRFYRNRLHFISIYSRRGEPIISNHLETVGCSEFRIRRLLWTPLQYRPEGAREEQLKSLYWICAELENVRYFRRKRLQLIMFVNIYLLFLTNTLIGLSVAANWCGTSWVDANRCSSNSCPGGVNRECPTGQRCFADISCPSNNNPSPVSPPSPSPPASPPSSETGAVISTYNFNTMFPSPDRLYSYEGFISAAATFPGFLTTGNLTVRCREAAAFFANIAHESCNLRCTVELNTANYDSYCDEQTAIENGFTSSCDKNGRRFQYYGRGPIQLSWNYNYKTAGDALGLDLLHDPGKVSTDSRTAWRTAIWFWMTSSGAGVYTPHIAMTTGRGFGETIRSINGALECGGKQPDKVAARVKFFRSFVEILGTTEGSGKLICWDLVYEGISQLQQYI